VEQPAGGGFVDDGAEDRFELLEGEDRRLAAAPLPVGDRGGRINLRLKEHPADVGG
jgi:hypothetical protein